MVALKSLQEIFDIAANHLIAQGGRSVMPNGVQCAYRGTDSRMCAVGCLIPDDAYRADMEGELSVCNTLLIEALIAAGCLPSDFDLDDPHMQLLRALQRKHDDVTAWPYIKGELNSIALQFGLKGI